MKNILLLFGLCLFSFTTFAQDMPVEAALLGQWSNPELIGSSQFANTYNEIWGIANGEREYAVIGSTAGTHFVDVTAPAAPQEVAFVEGRATGSQIIHRDYHNYGCYLYAVADEGPSSLQIMDISYLPDSVAVVYDSNETLARAHNIFIDEVQAKLYCLSAFGGSAFFSALRIYDISSPTEPVYLAEYNNFGGLTVNHVHDAYINDGIAYLNCGNDGFAVVDFTDPMEPQTLGLLTEYNFQGYNHSGWPANDGQHYYMADETHGYPMKVVDISDLEDIEDVGLVATPNEMTAENIPHNQIVACDYLYVSYYYHGVYVYDIADPANPIPVRFYDTSDWAFDNNYRGAWGIYPFLPSGNILVSDMQEGLFILEGPGDTCAERDARTLACEITTPTREPNTPQQHINVYPQPARTFLQLQLPTVNEQLTANVQLRDLQGRLLHQYPQQWLGAEASQLVLPPLPAGIYLLDIQTEAWQQTERVVVE